MPLAVVPGHNPRAGKDWDPVDPLINPKTSKPYDRLDALMRTREFRGSKDAEEKRHLALETLTQAIDEIVVPVGYRRKKLIWTKTSARGRTSVELKRSHNGDRADVLIDARRSDGSHPPGPWRKSNALRLALFYHPRERAVLPFEAISYPDILNGDGLKYPMRVVSERAVPWLEKLHSGPGGLTQIEHFLPRL